MMVCMYTLRKTWKIVRKCFYGPFKKIFNFKKTTQVISRNKPIFLCSFWLLLFLWRWLKCMALIGETLYDLRLRYFVRLLQCNIRYWFRNKVSASWWKTLSNIIYILFYNLELNVRNANAMCKNLYAKYEIFRLTRKM